MNWFVRSQDDGVCFYVDMDNTLLHTITSVSQIPLSDEEGTAVFGEEDSEIFEKAGYKHAFGNEYYSKIRPGAKEFLLALKSLGKIYLCTSASQDYADGALAVLGLDIFDGKFYRKNLYDSTASNCKNFFLIDDLAFSTNGIFQKMNFLGSGMTNAYQDDENYDQKRDAYEKSYSPKHIKVNPYYGKAGDSDLTRVLSEVQSRLSSSNQMGR